MACLFLDVRRKEIGISEREGKEGECWLHSWSTFLLKISTSSLLPIIFTACHVKSRVATFLAREEASLMTISLLDCSPENVLLWDATAGLSLYISFITLREHGVIFLLGVQDSNLEDHYPG